MMPIKTTQKSSKRVNFSALSSMLIIPNNTEELTERWYSPQECTRFRQGFANDARRMSRLLAATPRGMMTEEELQECTGIEIFLDQDRYLQLQARKDAHATSILNGQHVYSENKLSFIAKTISRPDQEYAWLRANDTKKLLEN